MTHKEIAKKVDSIHEDWKQLITLVTYDTSDLFPNKEAILDALHAVGNLMEEAEATISEDMREIAKGVECPYCHSHVYERGAEYECANCERIFGEIDIETEHLRHQLSHILSRGFHDEKNPLPIRVNIPFGGEAEPYHATKVSMGADGIIWFDCEDRDTPIQFDDIVFCDLEDVVTKVLKDYNNTTFEVCPFCGEEVALEAELKVQTCPNCGKRIVTCSMCEAKDNNCGDNYCKHCCLIYQADRDNEREF